MLLPSAGLGDQLKGIQIAVKSSKQQQQQHKYPVAVVYVYCANYSRRFLL
jgi:hypothetical protein